MMRNFICLFLVAAFLVSCRKGKQIYNVGNSNTLTIPLAIDHTPDTKLDIDQLVDSVRFVKLETNDECLIGKIKKVFWADGRFFIHETHTDAVLVFDGTGKFMYKIARQGKGPGEYITLSRLLLDEERKRVMIFDQTSSKMLYYSLDGTFIKELSLFSNGAIIRDLINMPDGRFICYTPDFTQYSGIWGIWEVDSSGKIGKTYVQSDVKYPAQNHFDFFYRLPNGQAGLWSADIDDIYHFTDTEACQYLSFIPDGKTVASFPGFENTENIDNNTILQKLRVVEKGNFIIVDWLQLSASGIKHHGISVYFKKEQKTVFVDYMDYQSNNIESFGGWPVDFNKPDQMINVIYAHTAPVKLQSEWKNPAHKERFSSLFTNEEENPVLEILYVKK